MNSHRTVNVEDEIQRIRDKNRHEDRVSLTMEYVGEDLTGHLTDD